jgi:hypothetical protein
MKGDYGEVVCFVFGGFEIKKIFISKYDIFLNVHVAFAFASAFVSC